MPCTHAYCMRTSDMHVRHAVKPWGVTHHVDLHTCACSGPSAIMSLLFQAVERAGSLDTIRSAHAAFLAAAGCAAMTAPDRAWSLVAEAVRHLLDLAFRFTDDSSTTTVAEVGVRHSHPAIHLAFLVIAQVTVTCKCVCHRALYGGKRGAETIVQLWHATA